MRKTPVSRWVGSTFTLLTAVLGLTGLLQLPLAKRYYMTEVPGLAWTGDFYLTHQIHYVAAILLLALTAYICARWFMDWAGRLSLTRLGVIRIALVTLLVLSGIARMVKNLPGTAFGPLPTMLLDFAHLGFAMIFGIAALVALMRGSRAYAIWKNRT